MALPQNRRQQIFRRDAFKCRYCGLDASKDFDTWYYANLNVDHINPTGGDDDSNLVTAAAHATSSKGQRSVRRSTKR